MTSDTFDGFGRNARTPQLGEILLRILELKAGITAQLAIGPSDVGLSGLPKSLARPSPPAGHDTVHVLNGNLHGKHADLRARTPDW